MPRLLTAYQVGAVFGVGEQTVHRWVRTRLLRCIQTADGRRFREEDVLAVWRLRFELEGTDATTEDAQATTPIPPATPRPAVPGRREDPLPDL